MKINKENSIWGKRASFSLPGSALLDTLSALVCELVKTLNSNAVRDAE